MNNSAEVLIGMAALAIIAMVAFIVFAYWQKRRNQQIVKWVQNFLLVRYGELPGALHINCSNDRRWPVLATFKTPNTGTLHSMHFSCGGTEASYAVVSEKDEQRN
jgi:hypothetical protein